MSRTSTHVVPIFDSSIGDRPPAFGDNTVLYHSLIDMFKDWGPFTSRITGYVVGQSLDKVGLHITYTYAVDLSLWSTWVIRTMPTVSKTYPRWIEDDQIPVDFVLVFCYEFPGSWKLSIDQLPYNSTESDERTFLSQCFTCLIRKDRTCVFPFLLDHFMGFFIPVLLGKDAWFRL